MKKIRINLEKDTSYDILMGSNCLGYVGAHIKRLKLGNSIFIITSPKIGGLYLGKLKASLKKAGFKNIRVKLLKDGEKYKDYKNLPPFYNELRKFDSIDKELLIVNLGGGVIGDFGGYVAATWKRGTRYIQIPTTLLACVDCGIGGKVGVNFEKTKNAIGAFYQPKLVYADLDLLTTLNTRERKSALAEIIKYGVICDSKLFELVETNYSKILDLDKKLINEIADKCYRIKAKIVEKDEKDTKGIRVTLNYGHTVGHAIEAAANYAYRHGEAISIGMVAANDIAVELGVLKREKAERIKELLKNAKLPTEYKNCRLSTILEMLKKDKKFVNGKNRFVLPTTIGKTVIKEDIDKKLIKKAILNRLRK